MILEADHVDFCGQYLCKWDGEYEGQCALPKGHRWPHYDGLTWFDDKGEDAETPAEALGYLPATYLKIDASSLGSSVPDELCNAVLSIVDSRYPDGHIDWDDVWNQINGMTLSDGRIVNIHHRVGDAINRLKACVRKNKAS